MNVRKGQAPDKLSRDEFKKRYLEGFTDPKFDGERDAILRLEEIAFSNYEAGRKAPITEKAGPEYEDPDYDLSVDWIAARSRIRKAEDRQKDPATKDRVLVICASDRNDGSCPGEMSKTYRLSQLACEVLREERKIDVDLLDLSLLTSEYGREIHPCKACVSTAMPLCHWPCSCYPNYSLGQVHDWMNEIYEKFALAHGVIFVTPVYWYEAPSALKLMIDRLVCADGGNVDPSSTHGKDAAKAKKIEKKGWDYPKHLAGRAYGVMVHGDAAGAQGVRRNLCDWLDTLGFLGAGTQSKIDRYIGYYEPYATSHDALDDDTDLQEEMRIIARAVANTVSLIRAGRFPVPDAKLESPRPK